MSDQQTTEMVYLGGLWVQTAAKSGEKYMAGGLGIGGKMLVFKNKRKETDNQPDYHVFLAPKPKKEEQPNDSDSRDEDIPDEDFPF